MNGVLWCREPADLCVFHRWFQGQVDLDGEINKCEKKLALAKMNLSKIEKFESQADYETTVPENVRLANDEKVRRTKSALSSVANLFLAEENVRG